MNILITGGAGFIGSAVIRSIINNTTNRVLNLDKLTYAGNLESLTDIESSSRYEFVHGDICDKPLLDGIFERFEPNIVMHLALFRLIFLVHITCWNLVGHIGRLCKARVALYFIIFQQTKYMVVWEMRDYLRSHRLMIQALHIQPLKLLAI